MRQEPENLGRRELAEHVGRLISSDRNATHGQPHEQFAIQRALIKCLAAGPQFERLEPSARHAIEMITTKLSRLASGHNLQDSWLDIAGYALIAAEHADEPLTKVKRR